MARKFRRTEEQLRASVRGLNRPSESEAAAAASAAEAEEPVRRPKAPRTKRRLPRNAPAVERITPPRQVPPAFAPEAPEEETVEVSQAGEPTQLYQEAQIGAAQLDEEAQMEAAQPHDEVLVEEGLPTQEMPAAATEPGAEAMPVPEAEPVLDGTAAVSARDAVKVYGEGANAVRAIDQVTHAFLKGRFTAIMGPSGSGKSTLLHCLGALDDLTSGKVFIGKTDVTALDEKGKTSVRRDKVGFIFQSYNLVPTLTALENITLPMELAQREPDQQWVNYLIQTVGLADRLDHLPSELSGGQQQRVAAVRALASKPEIVFADEPTGNLDSRRSAEILQFLRAAVDEFGQTIVMVTHDPIAACFADSVVFLVDGRVVGEMAGPTVDRVLDQIKELEPL